MGSFHNSPKRTNERQDLYNINSTTDIKTTFNSPSLTLNSTAFGLSSKTSSQEKQQPNAFAASSLNTVGQEDDFADFASAFEAPKSNNNSFVASSISLKTPNVTPSNLSPRNRTISSSSSTLSSQSLSIASLSAVASPVNPIKASSATGNEKLALDGQAFVANTSSVKSESSKDQWFQRFQQVQPEPPIESGLDDDFADFQNFSPNPAPKQSNEASFPTINETSATGNCGVDSNSNVIDKYAAFRELVIESNDSDFNFFRSSTDNPTPNLFESGDSGGSSTNIEANTTNDFNEDFADFTSFSSGNIDSANSFATLPVVERKTQSNDCNNSNGIEVKTETFADFQSKMSASDKDVFVNNNSSFEVKEASDWADFGSCEAPAETIVPSLANGDQVISKNLASGDEQDDDWTKFEEDENRLELEPDSNNVADVSGLVWAKTQVSADGLYDRIKQTILAEDVKLPAQTSAKASKVSFCLHFNDEIENVSI